MKGVFGRKSAIVQKQLHRNISLISKNAPSTMIKLKDDLKCGNNCSYTLDLLFNTNEPGIATLFLKYKNKMDYLAISITKSPIKTKITCIKRDGNKIDKLAQYINNKIIIKTNQWYSIEVKLLNDKLYMKFKNEYSYIPIFVNLISKVFVSSTGTIGLGTNNSKV